MNWMNLAALTPSLTRSLIVAPVMEEIVFRGFVPSGIELLQKGYNHTLRWAYKRDPSEADLRAQTVFRVRLSAILFGLTHFINYPRLSLGAIFQVSHCIFEGLTLGYLKEKTHSIALPILAHALNNTFATLLQIQGLSLLMKGSQASSGLYYLYLTAWLCNKLFWYLYATDNLPTFSGPTIYGSNWYQK